VHSVVQTLSKNICCSLIFCEELKLLTGTKTTTEFCEALNNVFGLTNYHNHLGKGGYFCAINDKMINYFKYFLYYFNDYIEGFKYYDINSQKQGTHNILKSQRLTGFFGLIILCLTYLLKCIYEVKFYGMSYLLSYTISKNHLEVFFSAIQSPGGFTKILM